MKLYKSISFTFFCWMFSTVLLAADATRKKPNILFILVDDQRNDTLGCAGHPVIKTPNIDELAKLGVRFENAYVNMPICMASRATFFSGLTFTGHGHTGGKKLAILLQKEDVDTSFPVKLRAAGYRTGFYGKQHVRFAEENEVALKRMFDDYKVYNGGPHFVKLEDGSERHSAELIGDCTEEFIKAQPKDQPFCAYMSFNIAHAVDGNHKPGDGHFPWPKAVDGMYEDIDPAPPRLVDAKYFDMQPEFLKESLNRVRWFWRWDTPEKYKINIRAYYRMLTGMDGVIGRVQKQLDEHGLAENTILIYTSDNGFYMGERGFAGKWSHYDESLRVPLIIYDPRPNVGSGEKGRVLPQIVTNVDLPATMLNLAGVPVPEKYQGKSLVPFMKEETPKSWREDFYAEFDSAHSQLPAWRGVHSERFSYAKYHKQNPAAEFLYDLKVDPDQLVNLVADPKHADFLRQMREKTAAYMKLYTRPEITAEQTKQAMEIKKSNEKLLK